MENSSTPARDAEGGQGHGEQVQKPLAQQRRADQDGEGQKTGADGYAPTGLAAHADGSGDENRRPAPPRQAA
jgi:hypothetical protein